MQKIKRVLGIETSCDETGLAIYDQYKGLIAHVVYSQASLHARYGGVVPELASRDHIRKLLPLLTDLLAKSGIDKKSLEGIAYCSGPGLSGTLLVGALFARGFGYGLGIPTLGIHHLEAHLLVGMMEDEALTFPFLALLISGGHTLLVHAQSLGNYKILGETLDDAIGEAFDKVAKILGLPYPGGPELEKLAAQGKLDQFIFPRPMVARPGLDFSFSGIKTFARTTFQASNQSLLTRANIAACFQEAVGDTLVIKCKRALKHTNLNKLVIGGGVAANKSIRTKLIQLMDEREGKLFFPSPLLCTDNGAMIAYTGWQRLTRGQRDNLSIPIKPRWPLSDLAPP